jgi:hypothetical protein
LMFRSATLVGVEFKPRRIQRPCRAFCAFRTFASRIC